jgi:NAD(P)-dependent dehydrogenase (short-subunit alcohol dehydrogenase family)
MRLSPRSAQPAAKPSPFRAISATQRPTIRWSKPHDAFGRLDILVNNAGITRDNLLLRMKADEIDDVLHTNLRGVMLLTKAALAQ